jgi:hypothetical protein
MNNFHNTIKEDAQTVMQFEQQNKKQNEIILQVFKDFPTQEFTPLQVWDVLQSRGYKILDISVKRCISDNTYSPKKLSGTLENTGNRVMERRGKTNFTWKLKPIVVETPVAETTEQPITVREIVSEMQTNLDNLTEEMSVNYERPKTN